MFKIKPSFSTALEAPPESPLKHVSKKLLVSSGLSFALVAGQATAKPPEKTTTFSSSAATGIIMMLPVLARFLQPNVITESELVQQQEDNQVDNTTPEDAMALIPGAARSVATPSASTANVHDRALQWNTERYQALRGWLTVNLGICNPTDRVDDTGGYFSDRIPRNRALDEIRSDFVISHILTQPENHTRYDVYCALWRIALVDANRPDIATIIHDSAAFLFAVIESDNILNQPLTSSDWFSLKLSLENLSENLLGSSDDNRSVHSVESLYAESPQLLQLIDFAFNSLYSNVYRQITQQIEQHFSPQGQTGQLTTRLSSFLRDFSILTTHPRRGISAFDPDPLGFVSNRVWFYLDQEVDMLNHRIPSHAHALHAMMTAAQAYYLLLLGQEAEAREVIHRLSEVEDSYPRSSGSSVESMVNIIVTRTLAVLDEQGLSSQIQNAFLKVMFNLMKDVQFPSHSNGIINAAQPHVLTYLRNALEPLIETEAFAFNPSQANEIRNEAIFQDRIIEPLLAAQEKIKKPAQSKKDKQLKRKQSFKKLLNKLGASNNKYHQFK